ncbi:MAG TPA: hypothetical protein VFD59_07980 [Nocardioidaceae bacterium]|nr:hypothetical protein [Nocardioidaceae bacterium]
MASPYKVYVRKLWFGVTQAQLDALDREVALYGGSRAAHVRRAVDAYLASAAVRRRRGRRA